jgi:acetylornithine deacetylase/succinyl-diaminopimelate desuccinylase-like protein
VRHPRLQLLAAPLVLVLACQPSIDQTQEVASVTVEASRDRLAAHVETLAGEIGERNVFLPEALQTAADYIESEWREQGYQVERQWYETHGVECANLEVTRTGTVAPEEILLIGAHYDSVHGSPGANDNGTGVAALLELSRLFIEIEPEISVRFVAFVNEEPPFFYWNNMGSMVYAEAAKKRGDQIRGMVSIETVGYYSDEPGSQRYPPLFRLFFPDRGNFIGFVSNFRSRPWLKQTVRAFKAHSDIPEQHVAMFEAVPGIGWSDHLSFWRQGWPALMITDTAPYRYPHYHTAEDTPDKVDYETLTRLTDGLFGTFVTLARSET